MADLDDFFAKKDKKKKGTKKFAKANTDVIAKNLIETERKELKELEKQEKELAPQFSDDKTVTPQASQEDEEWEEYKEKTKDFSGLKIETLTIQEPQPDEEEEQTEINEDGEVVKVKKDDSGPWNKVTSTNEPHQDLNQEAEVSIPNSNVVAGSYVPPHLRGQVTQVKPAPSGGGGGSRRGKAAAPDISSELSFPSLSSASEDANMMKGKGGIYDDGGRFEEVKERGGGQGYSSRHADAPKIALGNRFSSLRDGD
eukprot:TRINITY_DN276_c0_g1_i11.p1 TRINITY_DN276_c0_g1~~TRINITY_DN276_c0_g1_i11.p1  ORF type:complete len:255 (-),score=125.78 TRINITY_DN276_c0_g1_i11:1173-1937(-)